MAPGRGNKSSNIYNIMKYEHSKDNMKGIEDGTG